MILLAQYKFVLRMLVSVKEVFPANPMTMVLLNQPTMTNARGYLHSVNIVCVFTVLI